MVLPTLLMVATVNDVIKFHSAEHPDLNSQYLNPYVASRKLQYLGLTNIWPLYNR